MFKKFFIATVFFVLAVTQINFANAMSYGEMFLGSLTIGSSIDEMKRIYGEPTSKEGGIENLASCSYGNHVGIAYNNFTKKIYSVTISANNGWKTPSGLAVGDNISKALDLCGNPDYTKVGNFKTAYCYFHESYNTYTNKNVKDFGFIILFNKESGKILELSLLGGNSMASFEEIYQSMMKRMVE